MCNGSMKIQIYPEVTVTSKENIQSHGLNEGPMETGLENKDHLQNGQNNYIILYRIVFQAVP